MQFPSSIPSSRSEKDYPLRSFIELESFADAVRSSFEAESGLPAFAGDAVNIEVIADFILNQRGYSLQFVAPDEWDQDPSCRGKTIFSRKRVEICLHSHHKTINTTLAHELYHVLVHEGFALKVGLPEMPDDLERNAKDFARLFLLPADRFRSRFKELCRQFGVSFPASVATAPEGLIYRVLKDGIIPKMSDDFSISTMSICLRIKDLNLIGSRYLAQRILLDTRRVYSH